MATKRLVDGTEKAGKPDMEDFETRMLIDDKDVGTIIGKGGATVSQIRDETKTFISIVKNENKATERVVSVKGKPSNIATAITTIKCLLPGEAQHDPNATIEVKVLVHQKLVGSIIGKAGAVVQAIMSETGARVSLSKDPLLHTDEKTCAVIGTPQAVQLALTQVLERLEANPLQSGMPYTRYVPPGLDSLPYGAVPAFGYPAGGVDSAKRHHGIAPAPPYGASPYGAPPAAGAFGLEEKTEKIVIPTVAAGTIIGKGGSVARDIKAQSGLRMLSVADPVPGAPDDRVVTLAGSAHAIQHAIFLIRTKVESYAPPATATISPAFNPFGAPPAPMISGVRPTVPALPPKVEKLVIPTAHAGAVIGRSGSVIKDIQAQSGCTVSIAEADPASPTERVVTITGSLVGVQHAMLLIRSHVENAQLVSSLHPR